MTSIEIIPLKQIPLLKKGDPLVTYIISSSEDKEIGGLRDKDILVVSHTALCKTKGYYEDIKDVTPSKMAIEIAEGSDLYGKRVFRIDPRLVQIILNHSKSVIRAEPHLITESIQGNISAHSGIDKSNIETDLYIYPPSDPDLEAQTLLKEIKNMKNVNIGVIISDSQGRPFRIGTVGIALGVAGIEPLIDYRGRKDLYGYVLQQKIVHIADQLASTAQLVMGESDEGIPAAIIRGFNFDTYEIFNNDNQKHTIKTTLRHPEEDMFRGISSIDIIRGRKSFKGQFLCKPINENIIKNALNLVKFAPSARNQQPWVYYWIQNSSIRSKIIEKITETSKQKLATYITDENTIQQKVAESQNKFLAAPLFFIIALDKSKLMTFKDESMNKIEEIMAIQSVAGSIIYFLLGLRIYHIHSCWYNAGLVSGEKIKPILESELNENMESIQPQAIILAGYADEKIGENIFPERNKKNPLETYLKII